MNIALCGLGRYANILAKGLAEYKLSILYEIITVTFGKTERWKSKYIIPQKNIYNNENFPSILYLMKYKGQLKIHRKIKRSCSRVIYFNYENEMKEVEKFLSYTRVLMLGKCI